MSPQESLALAQQLIRAWNAHDVEAIAALHSPRFEGFDVADAAPQLGREDARRAAERYLGAFPDLTLTVDDVIADHDRLVLVWAAHGTHGGTVMRIPPSFRHVQVRGVCVLTLADGAIQRAVSIWDVAGMLRGIGLLPDLVPAEDSSILVAGSDPPLRLGEEH